MRRHVLMLLAVDIVLVAAATLLAVLIRDDFVWIPERINATLPYFITTLLVSVVVALAFGLNRSIWRYSTLSDLIAIVSAVLITVVTAVAISFLTHRLDGVARSLPVVQAILMMITLISVRISMRWLHIRRQSSIALYPASETSAGAMEHVLVVGINRLTALYLQAVADVGSKRVRVVGILGGSINHRSRMLNQIPVLGPAADVDVVLRDLNVHGVIVDRIVVALPLDSLPDTDYQALMAIQRTSNIRIDSLPDALGFNMPRTQHMPGSGSAAPQSALTSTDANRCELIVPTGRFWAVKRGIDLVGSMILLVVALPIIIVLAFIVIADVGWPAVFWQQRPGRLGHPIRIHKFRTMSAAYRSDGISVPEEMRLTAIGRFLRRTRLDELPQLLNILTGDMSFVGPRPLLVADQVEGDARRLAIRPGLTGWAQVTGGRAISAQDKLALDLWYVKHASLRLDMEILWRTIPTVLRGERIDENAIMRARAEMTTAAAPSKSAHDYRHADAAE